MNQDKFSGFIARRRWPKWLPWIGWCAFGILASALLVWIVTLWFGGVHGIEFSPQTFERRSYSFYELPIIGIQVTAIRHEDVTKSTELFLATNKYITPPKGGRQDWHIVIGTRGQKARRKGDASILMRYFDAEESGNYHRWVKWSEDHPKLAKVFWPAVQRLALHELYVFVPDLFDLAKRYDDPAALKQALDRAVVSSLLRLGRRLQDRGEHAEAIKVFDDALRLDPSNKDLQRARQTSKTALQAAKPTKTP
jgi:tetratricopeptide (TPR) repeat protein